MELLKNVTIMGSFIIHGQVADVWQKRIYPATITVEHGRISKIEPYDGQVPEGVILPGFIDSHVHIESSLLVPAEFARLAVVHGTVGTVSDPHEIANVCGMEGVEYMIRNGKTVPFKFYFGAPSCVPATIFETAGAVLDASDVEKLLKNEGIKYLSEMMNFPGVLFHDPEVMKKIAAAQSIGKPIDGHAPGLRGETAEKYIGGGEPGKVVISTDHECFTKEEALDKLRYGMKILIREGSAARNFEALIDLLNDHPEHIMFCSDDKHPDSLLIGHINQLCKRAIAKGIDLFKVLQAACINPVLHNKLDVGLLRPGDPADFIMVKDCKDFEVIKTWINGALVAENGQSHIKTSKAETINQFDCNPVKEEDLFISSSAQTKLEAIVALEGQLITDRLPINSNDLFIKDKIGLYSNPQMDLLKIVVVNRYKPSKPAIAFIKGFGFKRGALASSVAHDSHNIVAVGADDESICSAINLIIKHRGGLSCVASTDSNARVVLDLPVAGLMSNEDGYLIAESYTKIDNMAKSLGTTLAAPYMTLSFMALLVIPHLKLSDKGLFDGDSFKLL
jgi:adenine deaminase